MSFLPRLWRCLWWQSGPRREEAEAIEAELQKAVAANAKARERNSEAVERLLDATLDSTWLGR